MSTALNIENLLSHPTEPLAIIDCDTLQLLHCNRNFEDYFSLSFSESQHKDLYEVMSYGVSREKKQEIIAALKSNRIFIDNQTTEQDHIFISLILVDEKEYGFVRISNQLKYSLFGQYRQLFEQNLAGVYKVDIDGNILSCNEAFASIFGYDTAREMIGLNTHQLYKNPGARVDYLAVLREKRVLKNFEIQVIRKDQTIATCLENCYLEKHLSGNETISGTIIDFTEKKKIESDLLEREQWFESLANVSNEGVVFEQDHTIILCNNQFAKMFGYSLGIELTGLLITDFIPEQELKRIKSGLRILVGNKTEIRLYPNDKPLFIEVTGSYISFKGEQTLALVISNVTERKKTELALERSVVRFRNLLENLPNGVIILTDGRIKYLNHSACVFLGAVEEDDVYDDEFVDFIDEEFKEQIEQDLMDVRQGLDVEYTELKMVTLSHETNDAGLKMVLTVYENRPSVQVTLSNLSDRNQLVEEQMRIRLAEELNAILKQEIQQHKETQIQLEQEQRESSEQRAKLEAIFNSTENLMMWTVDKQGNITTSNRNFKNWSLEFLEENVSVGDNVIKHIEKYLDPDLYQGQMGAFQKAFKGKPQQTELPIRNGNDERIWLQLFLNPVYVDNDFNELSCLAYDNTERKAYEKSMRHSLKEKEVLLKEVHHRVKNNLQLISSMLNLQSSYVSDSATLDVLKESQQRINSMSLIHETIYRNSDFSAIDFSDYIKAIARNLVQSYHNPQVSVQLETQLDKVHINLDQSIPCGLILNELVSNAMKYAFVGRKTGKLSVIVKELNEGAVELTVKDDGVGVENPSGEKRSNSLGLTLVEALTEQLDGTMDTSSNNGTTYSLTFVRK